MISIDPACYQAEKMCEMLKSKLILIPAPSAPKSLLGICMIEIPLLASNNKHQISHSTNTYIKSTYLIFLFHFHTPNFTLHRPRKKQKREKKLLKFYLE